jgi:hypothetical protein
MIDDLERVANYVSDIDLQWWPFLFLRPAPHERMTSARVALLAALYGVLAGVVANVLLTCARERVPSQLVFPVATTMGFFVFYRLTFAACWNRRAARLCRGGRG